MLTETHRLSFGSAAIAGLYRPVSEADAEAVLTAAWDQGIRYFDTAPHYGHGASEHLLGRFLRDRDGWVLSTKVGRILTPDANPPAEVNGFHSAWPFKQHYDYTYDGIMRSVEDSYQRLGLNRIDILYVHDIGDPGAGTDTAEHRAQLLDSGVRALEELKSSGTVGAVGLGAIPCSTGRPRRGCFRWLKNTASVLSSAGCSIPVSWPPGRSKARITIMPPRRRTSLTTPRGLRRSARVTTHRWPQRRCNSPIAIRWWLRP